MFVNQAKEILKDLFGKDNVSISEQPLEDLYTKVCSYDNFEDFMTWLSEEYERQIEQASKEGRHIEDIDEQWDIVRIAQKQGRKLTAEELGRIGNCFLGSAYYYKGYVFGIMNGQGSCPWHTKWDSERFGEEQLSLF